MLESTTYPGTTREQVAPLLEASGSQGRRGLPPRVLARARRSRAASDWTTKTTPKVVGGLTEECTRPRGRALRERRRRACVDGLLARGRRADEAAREHLPLGQHRARQRARAALRPDGASTSGRSSTRPRRSRSASCASSPAPASAATASRSTRSTSPGRRASSTSTTEFIELAGKVNQNMPYFCRSLISQALNHGAQRSLSGSKVLVLGVAYKADISDIARVAGAEADRAAAARRAPRSPTTTRTCPSCRRTGSRSQPLEPAAYDCVAIVTAHSIDRLRDGRRATRS